MRKFKHYTIADVIAGAVAILLGTLAIGGILGFIGLWIVGEIDPTTASFGIYG